MSIKITRKNTPNTETIEALKESRNGILKSYKTTDDFWKAMKINPNTQKTKITKK